MSTYNKPLNMMEVDTLMGYEATAQDTIDGKREGSYALDAFNSKKIIKAVGKNTNDEVLIPFHAVQKCSPATVAVSDRKADPYGCEEEKELEYKLWFTGTLGECQSEQKMAMLTPTEDADIEAILANPSAYAAKINDTELPLFSNQSAEGVTSLIWTVSLSNPNPVVGYVNYSGTEYWMGIEPCDASGEVSVYIAEK